MMKLFECHLWLGKQRQPGCDIKRTNWAEVESCRNSWRPFWAEWRDDGSVREPSHLRRGRGGAWGRFNYRGPAHDNSARET